MRILGISAYYHDSAAALVVDGDIVAAAQEERFSRRKHDASFPRHAIASCLDIGRARLDDIDFVAFYDKPFLKFERLLETYLTFAPKGFRSFAISMPLWLKEMLLLKRVLRNELRREAPDFDWENKLLFAEHHQSHAASAFYPSPFDIAAILTMDGVGEWATTSLGVGNGSRLEMLKEIHFPHSLGLLYSAFTYYMGFKVNSGEYKVMGLAPYGTPKYRDLIEEYLIDLKPDGSFRLDMDYFDYCTGQTMTSDRFDALFGGPPRDPGSPIEQRDMDLAASIQAVTDDAVLRLAKGAVEATGTRNLCLAGGVALNCVTNGRIVRDGVINNLWVQPAAGDAGGALGSALAAYHSFQGSPRRNIHSVDAMKGSYLGPEFTQQEIESRLQHAGAAFETAEVQDLVARTADSLADGLVVGWFQGRMEFGPRALGNRSILADPRSPTMQRTLNLKVKHRKGFRPFAPAVTREHVADWFDLDRDSPYMLLVTDVNVSRRRKMSAEEEQLFGVDKLNVVRSEIPAVTHVDCSARVQTVHKETNPRFHALIDAFGSRTGCPVLVNTSFNIRGEPIVATPEDAFRCFMGTELDLLVIGDCILRKDEQNPALKVDYRATLEPD